MKKKILKVLSFLLIILVMYVYFSSIYNVYAAFDYSKVYTGDISKAGGAEKKVKLTLNAALTVIRYAGSGIALIMLTVIFIKYMLSASGERAELKKNLIPFTLGAIILFAASNLAELLKEVADGMFKAK